MNLFLEVAFPLPLDKTFHYRATEAAWPDPAWVGRRVRAPFGQKSLVGFVVATTHEQPPYAIKPIEAVLDPELVLPPAMVQLTRWVADRTMCAWGEALACAWPAALQPPKRVRDTEVRSVLTREAAVQKSPSLQLTDEQQAAVEAILPSFGSSTAQTFLLHGITDSGKTEVYWRVIDAALSHQHQALYLLPEIAMTPPFYHQMQQRYGAERVAIWHSHLSPGERYRVWTAVARGEIDVLLGARSAVFAPFPRLGVVILDEEHEPAYKQEDRPRYHTREVLLKRAELENLTVVMGSATPSLESYWQASQGRYRLLELKERIEKRRLPSVHIVDRRAPQTPGKKQAHYSIFSEELRLALEQRLARREQSILFVNRRGFTPFLRCSGCGWVARCERCSLAMAVHMLRDTAADRPYPVAADTELVCHGCYRRQKSPVDCPSCKTLKLRLFGVGTQRIERDLQHLFPFAKIARLDSDSARSAKTLASVVERFASGEIDILVGTQMIAKGFDFPRVTLVGVVDADVSLHLPDFRSSERTFDLIAQVAGRAGRGARAGSVVVQTHYPEHPAIVAAQTHDYKLFYEGEIRDRQALRYPPFCELIRLVIQASKEPAAQEAAEALAQELESVPDLEVLGPAPAAHERLRRQYRYHLLLKGPAEAATAVLNRLRGRKLAKAFLAIDINPLDML